LAVAELGPTLLEVKSAEAATTRRRKREVAPPAAEVSPPIVEAPEKRGRKTAKKIRRKRRSRKPGEPSITEILGRHVPTTVHAYAKAKDWPEFTAKDIFKSLQDHRVLPARVKVGHVSLYLGQHSKKLGLKCEQRKVARGKNKSGKPLPPVVTNFFSAARGKKTGHETTPQLPTRATRQSLALARGLLQTEFKGRVFTPPQLAASLKKNYGVVLRNIHSSVHNLLQAGLIKRAGKGQYQA
jgi:hypothetical protein